MTGWRTTTIGEACAIFSGGTPSKANADYWHGPVPWVSAKDLKTDRIFDAELHISQRACEESAAKLAPVGSLLMLVRGMGLANGIPIGEVTSSVAFNQDLRAIVPPSGMDSRFLLLALRHRLADGGKDVLSSAAHGTLKIDAEALRRIQFPVPSLNEQRRIVTILDEAFEGIATAKANAEKCLRNASEAFEGAAESFFAHPGTDVIETSLAEVCDIGSKLVDPREPAYLDLPHIGAGNIESKSGAVFNVRTSREEQLISGKFLYDEGAVLYSKIRPYLMKVVRPTFNGLCSADIYPLIPKAGRIERDYLYHLLLSPRFTQYASEGSARAGMPKVNREHLFAYRFALPSVQAQEKVAGVLDALFHETRQFGDICKCKLAALDELKRSLLHQAFTGGLS